MSVIVRGKWKGRWRRVGGYVEINSYWYQSQWKCRRCVKLLVCPVVYVRSCPDPIVSCGRLLDNSQLPHPLSPNSLDLDGRMYFLPKFVCLPFLVCLIGIFSPASQASMPPRSLTIFKDIVIVVFIFSIVDCDCPTLRCS